MKDVLHKTLTGILREHVIKWRKDEGWSRETVAQVIIEAHEKYNAVSGIVFEPQTKDVHEAREVNAQRIFRWLDDETKSNNTIPANFIPSVFLAMPISRRAACASELLVSIGLGVRMLDDAEDDVLDINDVFEVQIAHGMALQASTQAIQNPTPENLEAADLHLAAFEKKNMKLRQRISAAKARAFSGVKAIINKCLHRKQKVTQ